MNKQYAKENVCETYNKISNWFHKHRSLDLSEKPYLDQIVSLIKKNNRILDLGCGTGKPIAEYLIKNGFEVTGVDASEKQIALASKELPNMKCIYQDMRSISLNEKFNCIIAWHSFFHLNKSDQRSMFKVFEDHITSNGILVFTSGTAEGEIYSDNGGEILYHASLSQAEYKKLLHKHNFELLSLNVEDPNCGYATIWLAKYKN
ncbi:class I SAM-dependent DNA methyltransferase [Francisella sp. SYW-9]|uniref:class I SAM-dependent DNA methyltransferase n=1 Tax=Francisella sp. SYW-9 TaxID=2610888 RepID=UPI00123D94D0|nr:class I SAM-dependent methyltransferase [Francisella sp. SYW-9]